MTSLQKARFAVFAYFTIAGSAMTFWAVHIPYVENKLDIPHSTIGALLLVLGAGALSASVIVGQFIDRVGSRTATFTAAVFMAVMLFFPGFATNEIFLGLSLLVWALELARQIFL